MWGRGLRGNNAACSALCQFSATSPTTHKQIGPSGADSQVGGFVYVLGPCGSIQWSLLWGWEFLLQPEAPQVFSVRGFEALFPWTGTLSCAVYLSPPLFLKVYLHVNVGLPGPPATTLPWVLSTRLPISAPPTGLDECFFFNSLVVRLPYSSIFWQFCLVFVFKFVVVLFLVVRGGTVVYLCLHLGWKSLIFILIMCVWGNSWVHGVNINYYNEIHLLTFTLKSSYWNPSCCPHGSQSVSVDDPGLWEEGVCDAGYGLQVPHQRLPWCF